MICANCGEIKIKCDHCSLAEAQKEIVTLKLHIKNLLQYAKAFDTVSLTCIEACNRIVYPVVTKEYVEYVKSYRKQGLEPMGFEAWSMIDKQREEHMNMFGLLKTLRQSKSMKRYWSDHLSMSVLVDKILAEAVK